MPRAAYLRFFNMKEAIYILSHRYIFFFEELTLTLMDTVPFRNLSPMGRCQMLPPLGDSRDSGETTITLHSLCFRLGLSFAVIVGHFLFSRLETPPPGFPSSLSCSPFQSPLLDPVRLNSLKSQSPSVPGHPLSDICSL